MSEAGTGLDPARPGPARTQDLLATIFTGAELMTHALYSASPPTLLPPCPQALSAVRRSVNIYSRAAQTSSDGADPPAPPPPST